MPVGGENIMGEEKPDMECAVGGRDR